MTETTTATDALYRQFADLLAKVGATCHRAADVPFAAEAVENILGGSDAPLWTAPMVRDTLPALVEILEAAGVDVRFPSDAAEARDQRFGLSVATQAIAETGSVLLVARELADRAASLMTETHIVVCPTAALAPSLDDAGETLAAVASENGSYATLLTGPSRTADIERHLTVGVQGPARLHVIMIDQPA